MDSSNVHPLVSLMICEQMKCYLKHNNDPFYRLNPFKEEVVHLEPGIWVYHDVASVLDTDAIRSTAAPFVSCCYIHILGSWYFLFLISKWKYYFTKVMLVQVCCLRIFQAFSYMPKPKF